MLSGVARLPLRASDRAVLRRAAQSSAAGWADTHGGATEPALERVLRALGPPLRAAVPLTLNTVEMTPPSSAAGSEVDPRQEEEEAVVSAQSEPANLRRALCAC